MYRAEDKERDQSYFLFSTTQSQLDYLRFPLGLINKSETRNIANKLNLNVATKPDSKIYALFLTVTMLQYRAI